MSEPQQGCWHSVSGGITRSVDDEGTRWTTIRLGGRNRDGYGAGQCLRIQTERVEKIGLKRVLDNMALDMRRYDLV